MRPAASDAQYLVALTTLESADEARALVRKLVDERVIACGTVLPGAVSIYRWAGEVTEAGEAVVLMKTRRERWTALETSIQAHHPYDVPELVGLAVDAGLAPYLAWVRAETEEHT